MKKIFQTITDFVTTRKGMWTTIGVWLFAATLLGVFAPGAKEYEVSSINSLPEDAQSVIAQNKIDEHFEGADVIPAILVFQANEGDVELAKLVEYIENVENENIAGLKEIVPLSVLPPQAISSFFSEDNKTAILPLSFDSSLEAKELKNRVELLQNIADETEGLTLYITGPAGIAVDTLNLFTRADIVLILATVAIVLVLLIVIYRSPLLALIPLIAIGFVYMVVNQLIGLMGQAGLLISNQTISIMMILLFAAVTDYSLFVFSRYREELKEYENKFMAMKMAMRETGIPVFFAGGTVLAAMLVLFFATYGDYRNFAPIFGTTMAIIMIASITLIPALFTLFGRKSFWPKVPKVGESKVKSTSIWSKIGKFVVRKPIASGAIITIFLLLSASNLLNLKYEFDLMKSFPNDMSSRVGYELLEEEFHKGDLAPTTVLFEAKGEIEPEKMDELRSILEEQAFVSTVRKDGQSETAVKFSLTFEESPYAVETLNAFEEIRAQSDEILAKSNLLGELHFAGETATTVDDRSVNKSDLTLIVILESLLIFGLLIILTKSFKMPIYMMGTILLSFLAALGLGMWLSSLFFDISTISTRVPVYSFVFLVALGVDYNIILVSRYLEERKKHSVKKAVEIAVASTGGVISSAGIILAATFAVLMTQPVEVLFVFGFIVAVGILLDTFLIRGILLPSLIVLFEKDKASEPETAIK